MENKKIQLLASGLIKTWKQDDNIVGFVSHLKNDKKIRHFFTNQSDDDLFKVAMLIQGIKNGFSGRDELKKIEDSLFSFSIIILWGVDQPLPKTLLLVHLPVFLPVSRQKLPQKLPLAMYYNFKICKRNY